MCGRAAIEKFICLRAYRGCFQLIVGFSSVFGKDLSGKKDAARTKLRPVMENKRTSVAEKRARESRTSDTESF